MDNISFGKAKVFVNPGMYVKNAKSSEIAEAINIGVKQAGKELGVKIKHPNATQMTGKLLREANPDSFHKTTQTLTDAGKKGFNKLYGSQMGVTTNSKMSELIAGVKSFAMKIADPSDGALTYSFKYMG